MLEVAGRVFAVEGYHGASMDEIAEGVGVTKPMLYSYFGSKEGLYLAYMRQAGAELLRSLREASDPATAPRERLRAGLLDRVEHHHEWVSTTRNGREAAVLISPEDLAQLEETVSAVSDASALADIREADVAYARGDVLRGIAAVRDLRR